ncbi:Protein CBG14064 [Caenorhabditis briggsae]|uniref:Uncharacterized protein n=3 Tax=Caenorhabditis briggsae TaxID=6238 RepID=A0AAE8ZP19_CAEBR|nr:Protein CBG14064 [Caenorhabditis briggsae]ULT81583.1 hypothetical protein L3Y34_011516 [Caenorhabditis briggsae]UMM40896.1 hypothetical protein L5515_017392 [Caenorhabditis briggsae]CAP32724.2 Protein CBG14064 [Caenorhabditis briggsae]
MFRRLGTFSITLSISMWKCVIIFSAVFVLQTVNAGFQISKLKPMFKEDNATISELSTALGAAFPPCCSDIISSIACRRLQQHNPSKFLDRCATDADFSLIQCCNTCGLESAADRYELIFQAGHKSNQCFDRHGPEFCKRFLKKEDVWGKSQWSCDGSTAHLAFRICRKTCNFCRRDIYRTPLGRFEPVSCGKPPVLIPI